MIFQDLTSSFKRQLLEATHDFTPTTGHVFKIALYDNTANLNSSTTAYTTTGEIVATGYTLGGMIITTTEPADNGTVGYVNFADATWTGASFTARGALIYNTTPNGIYSNPSVMVLDFGMDRLTTPAGVFVITMPQNNSSYALIRIADSNA